ncbi:MAG TPA: carbohydrate ABC transporter substrate-binding protein [Acidimicrobiia bacterium]|nr:carbohydrate ABC transporter substrate-binding protein [Acidimicrobiia bacterium]
MDRRAFLRFAGSAAGLAAVGCGSESNKRGATATTSGQRGGERTLRIAQWSAAAAGLPTYDDWFDNQYTQRWGEQHGIRVAVDHFSIAELSWRAEAEVAAEAGHDIFSFSSPPASLEDHVIDHREMVDEVEAKLGKATPLMQRCIFNPKTGKFFGFPEFWTPQPVHYRVDLWDAVAPTSRPATWEDIRLAGPSLLASGHSVGIGMSEHQESSLSLLALMHSYGASVQDAEGRMVLKSSATIEAVKVAMAIFKSAMSEDVFGWDAVANNRLLASGKGALIINGISAMRAVEAQDPALASKIGLRPMLQGPAGAWAPYFTGVSVIWKFAREPDLARQFLIDLAIRYREAFLHSDFYKVPAFPGAVPDMQALVANDKRADPSGKYGFLAEATSWSTNLGHPGHANAAMEDVLNRHLIPRMFAMAVRGEKTAEEAVELAAAEAEPIFDKWRERGKI